MQYPSSILRNLLFVFLLLTTVSVSAQSPSNTSLSAVLNPDGSVKPNITGNFDPTGYRLASGPNGEPRFVAAPGSAQGGCSDSWDTAFSINGTDSSINAVVSDGSGNVYVGGNFSAINTVVASRIAKWNGTTWSALGSGLGGGNVVAIAVSGSDVYVGGGFTTAGGVPANRVAKWDGNAWSAMGAGLGAAGNDFVSAIAVSGTNVYAGGHFADAGSLNYIARWNGTSWVSMGTGMNNSVESLAVLGTNVYAGGIFSTAGGVSVPRLARWDGASWSAIGTGLSGDTVSAFAVSGSDIYAGTWNGVLAKWNGTSWDSIGTPVSGTFRSIRAIAVSGTDIYVGGEFTTAGGSPANRIARWNGSQWSSLGVGVGDSILNGVNGIAILGDTLMVGGSFPTAGGAVAKNIATWSSGTWSAFNGTGLDGEVWTIAVSGTDVYVGGSFTLAGTLPVNRIAKWNGSTWSALGSGVTGSNNFVNAVAVAGGKVYAGGTFTNIGGVSASNIAVWNGSSWSALGSGVNATVFVITVVGQDVYVGGDLTTAGGVTANRIAKWNGTSWSGLNSGIIPNSVGAIVASGDDLYVGVAYTTLDGPNYFLKYDGSTWTPLGAGMTNGAVSSIAISGTDVYVAGGFNAVGGISAARIAKWNGSSWSALGSGLPGNSGGFDIAMSGRDLLAAGNFSIAGGSPVDRIARWNGSTWSALGSGVNGTIANAVTVAGGDVYFGGNFTRAGCNLSPYFARWRETVWTASINTDWHAGPNWGSGSVPLPNSGVTIQSGNASITAADVTVSNLIVTGGRTLTIGAGRTLTVTGNLDLNNGTLVGPGALVVSGDLSLNGGDIINLSSIFVSGNLYLNGGKITGGGRISVLSCRTGAIVGGSNTSFIESPLDRCVNSSGTYRFPVGTGSVYSPVELANVVGSATFVVEAKSGAYPNPASGLPSNRLQRWWELTNGGITQADVSFYYSDADILNFENRHRAFRISGGVATQVPTILDTTTNRATVTGVSAFSSWTLAEGISTQATLTGRVTTASGRGAFNVTVTMTDEDGNVRSTITNHFGYYRFLNVDTVRVYIMRVRSKKYTYPVSQRSVMFEGDPINFVSSDH